MTRIFYLNLQEIKKIAMTLYSWLNDFKLIGDTWIDVRELKPGMKLEKSIYEAICLRQYHRLQSYQFPLHLMYVD
jgi:hypothetical protein